VSTEQAGARVEAQHLSRHFGDHVALDDLSLAIERGETFGLLGANGAGKTTFIRLVTGYLLPTAGSITVDGLSPGMRPREVHTRLGFAAEQPRVYPDLRVRQYLELVAGIRAPLQRFSFSSFSRQPVRDAVDAALERFDLTSHARRLVGNLSKGYQQRVSLAQAFLYEPSLLIVDEPTSGLDPLQRAEVRDVIADLRGHRTIILCTHDLAVARQLTSRVAVLYEGRLVSSGPTDEILGGLDPLALFRGRSDAPPEPPRKGPRVVIRT
jgi:ABC-2 type transport system ATP-binding protein